MKRPCAVIVDDDAIFRVYMSELCHDLGFEIATFGSADDCLHHIDEKAPEAAVILMDIHMPKRSGAELAAVLKTGYGRHSAPIVAVTSDPSWSDARRLDDHGMSACLSKPCTIDELASVLKFVSVPTPQVE